MQGSLLTAFWISTVFPSGCGVTAYSIPDALELLESAGIAVTSPEVVREGVTVADLDANHIVSNMGVITRRGVWYPNLNSSP